MSEQHLPQAGKQSVTQELMKLLLAREKKGIETYGRSLETFNGRSAERDLVEELIDATQYALQIKLERRVIMKVVEAALYQIDNWDDNSKVLGDAVDEYRRVFG